MVSGSVADFGPFLGFRAQATSCKFLLVLLELAEEGWTHFEVGATRIQKFKGLHERPAVATHQPGADRETRPIHCFHRLDQH